MKRQLEPVRPVPRGSYRPVAPAVRDRHEEAIAVGQPEPALKWLQATAENGFPQYPLFRRDAYLNPIRDNRAFVSWLAGVRTQWEMYRRNYEMIENRTKESTSSVVDLAAASRHIKNNDL